VKAPRVLPTAYDRALRLLGQRPHFRRNLSEKLIRKGYDEAEVEAALDGLAAAGYLNDRELAIAEAGRLRERRGLARAGVAAALRRKGAGDEAVEAALSETDDEDELALALESGRRWLRKGREDGAALARHLARKGHSRRVIFRILKELLPGDERSPEVV
jgi:regulatory protein